MEGEEPPCGEEHRHPATLERLNGIVLLEAAVNQLLAKRGVRIEDMRRDSEMYPQHSPATLAAEELGDSVLGVLGLSSCTTCGCVAHSPTTSCRGDVRCYRLGWRTVMGCVSGCGSAQARFHSSRQRSSLR